MTRLPFIKMHGIGNDFVIVDARVEKITLSDKVVGRLCDRHTGVGCDQLVVLGVSELADCFVRFYNPDGSESGACGNATRCVAHLVMREKGVPNVVLETKAGLLACNVAGQNEVAVNMGKYRDSWQDIPLASDVDTWHVPVSAGPLSDAVAVSMGNPHAVFFVDDVATVDLAVYGAALEVDAMFPERANIGVAQVVSDREINLRVWERGAGETLACGSGACAAAVAAVRRELTGGKVQVNLPGGSLQIEVRDDKTVMMTGPVAAVFTGVFNMDQL